jgi:glycosyltransferase involved in cell wall biosynthesis
MVIAVNTRFLLDDYQEGYGNFIAETFSRLAAKYQEHTFIYIFDRPYSEKFITAKNIIPVVISPSARHPLLWQYWYNYKIPLVLKKYKANVFVSPDGFCSLRTKIPQCMVVHDLAFLYHPAFMVKSHAAFYKKNTPKFIAKAKTIATVSAFTKNDICKTYNTSADKIDVVYNGIAENFSPLNFEERELIKEKYSNGKEYFLCTGAIHPRKNLMNLLKAFSVFKRMQKSNMQLLIAGRHAWMYEEFVKSLQSYKYRNDVKLLGYLPQVELAKITASAYTVVYPSFFEGFGVPPIEAMACNVPVVTSNTAAIPEICGDAALFANPASFEDIADKMMQLFKDENKRNELIKKGKIQQQQYSWDKTASLLWNSILKAMQA